MTDSLLRELVDDELGSVVFVMDYLQLYFGEARFTAYVWPTVAIGDVALQYGDPGYYDALCAFIAHKVTSAEESTEAGLAIRFGLGEIVINPEPADLTCAEIALLQLHKGPWEVWRPGEGVFVDLA